LADRLKDEFFVDTNRIIFSAIKELFDLGLEIDSLTIVHALKRIKNGGAIPESIIKQLWDDVDETKYESYLAVIIENYKKIQVKQMCTELMSAINANKSSIVLGEIFLKYSGSTETSIHRPKNIADVAKNVEKQIEQEIIDSMTVTRIVEFGVEELDKVDSMRPGNIYCYAGIPASGKTSLAIQSLYYNTFIKKKKCVFFSLEMLEEEVLESFYCFHFKITNSTFIKMPLNLKLKEIQKFRKWMEQNQIPLIIDGNSSTIEEMYNKSKALHAISPIELFAFDYLQLIKTKKSFIKRNELIEYIGNEIKLKFTKEFQAPAIVLSQMNRNMQNDNYRLPIMADLKESSGIEQVCTSIYFVHRVDPMIKQYFDENGELKNEGQTLFVCAKSRFAPTGIYQSWFVGACKRFLKERRDAEKLEEEVIQNCKPYLTN